MNILIFCRSKREASKIWCKNRTVLERILFCVVLICIGIIVILLVLHAITLQEQRGKTSYLVLTGKGHLILITNKVGFSVYD